MFGEWSEGQTFSITNEGTETLGAHLSTAAERGCARVEGASRSNIADQAALKNPCVTHIRIVLRLVPCCPSHNRAPFPGKLRGQCFRCAQTLEKNSKNRAQI